MYKLIIVFVLLFQTTVWTQSNLQTWAALQVGFEWSKVVLQTDVGYRFQDVDVFKSRQSLGRCVFLLKQHNFLIGGGFASFQHIKENRSFVNENRPFFQLDYRRKTKGNSLNLRARHEFRFFENASLIQRTRIKLDWRFGKKKVQGVLGQELFISHSINHLFESRTQLGISITLPFEQQILSFYQLNFNSINQQQFSQVLGLTYLKRITISND